MIDASSRISRHTSEPYLFKLIEPTRNISGFLYCRYSVFVGQSFAFLTAILIIWRKRNKGSLKFGDLWETCGSLRSHSPVRPHYSRQLKHTLHGMLDFDPTQPSNSVPNGGKVTTSHTPFHFHKKGQIYIIPKRILIILSMHG